MIEKFPTEIETVLTKAVPPTHKFWWVRGVVLSVGEIERATANPEKQNPGGRLRNMVIQIGDLDHPLDGYDLEIEGVNYQIEPNDVVSLLGHEEKGAAQVSAPRLLINHNTGGLIERAYPRAKSLDWGVLPMVERKYWLSAKTPANPAEKFKNLWIGLGALALPFVLLGFMMGPLGPLIIMAMLFFLFAPWVVLFALAYKYFNWLEGQSRFSFETDLKRLTVQNYRAFVHFNRYDLTTHYEKLARALHIHAVKNPAPDVDFVIVDRGSHTNGLLSGSVAPAATKPKLPPNANAVEGGDVAL